MEIKDLKDKAQDYMTNPTTKKATVIAGLTAAVTLVFTIYDGVADRWDKYSKRKNIDQEVILKIVTPKIEEARAYAFQLHLDQRGETLMELNGRKAVRNAELNAKFEAINNSLSRLDNKVDQILMRMPRR